MRTKVIPVYTNRMFVHLQKILINEMGYEWMFATDPKLIITKSSFPVYIRVFDNKELCRSYTLDLEDAIYPIIRLLNRIDPFLSETQKQTRVSEFDGDGA